MKKEKRGDLVGIGLCVVLFLFYAERAMSGPSLFGDSAEMEAAAHGWGVAHPPGYSVLTTLAHLAFQIGGSSRSIHLTSALFHALTVFVVFRLMLEWTNQLFVALGTALVLSLSRSFFISSLYYEAFPLNHLLCALSFYLAVRIRREFQGKRLLDLTLLSATLGVAGAHHHMAILVVPSVLMLAGPFLFSTLRSRQGILVIAAGIVPFLASLLLLLLLGGGDAPYRWREIETVSDLFFHFTRQEYGGLLSSSTVDRPWRVLDRQLLFSWVHLSGAGAPALLLAACGAWVGFTKKNLVVIAIALWFLLAGPMFFFLNRVELAGEENFAWVERFASFSMVPLACLCGLGVLPLVRTIDRKPLRWALGGALLLVALAVPVSRSAAVDLSTTELGSAFAHDVIETTEDNALLMVSGDSLHATLKYACAVQELCGERSVLSSDPFFYSRYVREAQEPAQPDLGKEARRLFFLKILRETIPRRPVYLTPILLRKYPEVMDEFQVIPHVLHLRVLPRGAPVKETITRHVDQALEGLTGTTELLADESRPSMHQEHRRYYLAGLTNLHTYLSAAFPDDPRLRRLLKLRARLVRSEWKTPWTLSSSGQGETGALRSLGR